MTFFDIYLDQANCSLKAYHALDPVKYDAPMTKVARSMAEFHAKNPDLSEHLERIKAILEQYPTTFKPKYLEADQNLIRIRIRSQNKCSFVSSKFLRWFQVPSSKLKTDNPLDFQLWNLEDWNFSEYTPMNRQLCVLLAALIGFVTYSNSAQSQDKIERKDRKAQDKLVIISGDIVKKVPPASTSRPAPRPELIPPHIVRVVYNKVPVTARLPFNNLFLVEEKEKDPAKLLKLFKDFEPFISTAGPEPKRYVQYRVAMLSVHAAKKQADLEQALVLLTTLIRAHPNSGNIPWQHHRQPECRSTRATSRQRGKRWRLSRKMKRCLPISSRKAANMYVDVLFQNNEFDKVKERIAAAKAAAGNIGTSKNSLGSLRDRLRSAGRFQARRYCEETGGHDQEDHRQRRQGAGLQHHGRLLHEEQGKAQGDVGVVMGRCGLLSGYRRAHEGNESAAEIFHR